jgi:copper transport protein
MTQSGHVVTSGLYWLAATALVLHVGTAAFWIGSLVPLYFGVSNAGREAAPVVRRFSRAALFFVAVLLIAGTVIAVLQVRSIDALVMTLYGRILFLKLVAAAALLSLAALNKLRLTPALARGDPAAGRTLRKSIGAELALAALILVATAALGTTPPPRVAAASDMPAEHAHHGDAATSPIVATTSIGERRAGISLISGAGGTATLDIALSEAGKPLEAAEVAVAFSNIAAGIEPLKRTATRSGPGNWHVSGLDPVPPGRWSVRVDALIGDFEKVVFELEIDVR